MDKIDKIEIKKMRRKEKIKERIENFLKEYEALCKKYYIYIGACGCCDSPWLCDLIENEEELEKNINHLKEEAITYTLIGSKE